MEARTRATPDEFKRFVGGCKPNCRERCESKIWNP
jgi:hypothetical protein